MRSLGKGVVTWSWEQYRSNASKEYNHFWQALFRELIQNSNDAGATNIWITIHDQTQPHYVCCEDDGCGMSLDVIQNKLLVIGGSHKAAGSVGGLGKAKELLFFSHPHWIIHTGYHRVEGYGGEYEIFELSYNQPGTKVILHQPDDVEMSELRNSSGDVGHYSQLSKAKLWINEQMVVSDYLRGKPVQSYEDMGDIHYRKKTSDGEPIGRNYYAQIRVNGVWMFERYVGEHQGQIILEIDSNRLSPIKGLSASRDSLKDPYRGYLDQFVQSLAVDKERALKKREPRIHRIKGSGDVKVHNEPTDEDISRMAKLFEAMSDNRLDQVADPLNQARVMQIVAMAKIPINQISSDELQFYAKILGYDPDFIVYEDQENDAWAPSRVKIFMKTQKAATIANVWTETIRQVCIDCRVDLQFTAGFFFDKEDEAMYLKSDGRKMILVNPLKVPPTGIQNKVSFMNWMRTSAVHEVTHEFCPEHNSDFVARYHDLESKTWPSHRIYAAIGKLR